MVNCLFVGSGKKFTHHSRNFANKADRLCKSEKEKGKKEVPHKEKFKEGRKERKKGKKNSKKEELKMPRKELFVDTLVDKETGWASQVPVPKSPPSSPKSPVQIRLEKRCRSPESEAKASRFRGRTLFPPVLDLNAGAAEGTKMDINSPINLAKKRRQDMLDATAAENGRRYARVKQIARKTSEERAVACEALASSIEDKLRAAELRRAEILEQKKSRVERPRSASQERRPSIILGQIEAKISEAEERRCSGFEKRLSQVRSHLDRVKLRCDRLRTVRALQSWWRCASARKKVAVHFRASSPSEKLEILFSPYPDGVDEEEEQVGFEVLAEHLATPEVITAAQSFLNTLRARNRNTSGGKPASPTSVSSARSFLANMMIVSNPEIVLGEDGEGLRKDLRTKLFTSAKRLFRALKKMRTVLGADVKNQWKMLNRLNSVLVELRTCHLVYARLFISWKQVDALCLAEEMEKAYVEIRVQNLSVADMIQRVEEQGGPQDPGLLQHLEGTAQQLASLREKVKKLLSPAQHKSWVKRVKASIAQRRGTAPPMPNQTQSESPKRPDLPVGPEPGSAGIPSNERMVYELMLDPSYKLSEEGFKVSLDCGKLQRAFSSKHFSPFVEFVSSTRQRLAALTPNRADLVEDVTNRLDDVIIAQQLEAGVFDAAELYDLVQFIGERILALQAEVRQSSTEAWLMELHEASRDEKATWAQLAPLAMQHILEEMGRIDLDMANFHLEVLSAHLLGPKGDPNQERSAGAEYLRSKFAERLSVGEYQRGNLTGAPERTERWVADAYDCLTGATSGRPPSLEDCLIEGFVQLLCDTQLDSAVIFAQAMPETLREHNVERMWHMHELIQRFSSLAIHSMLVQQVVRVSSSTIPEERSAAADIYVEFGKKVLGSSELTQEDLVDFAERVSGECLSKETKDMLLVLMAQQQAESSPLRCALKRQIENIFRKVLREPGYDCGKLLHKAGLLQWKTDFDFLSRDICQLFMLNQSVHRTMYSDIYVTKRR